MGERHVLTLRIAGPTADAVRERLVGRLEEAEFAIPGQIVADVAECAAERGKDGTLTLVIEALTVAE